jgi:hypothetical protein
VKGQLYHLVGTQENGVFRLYVNGVLAGEYASTQQLSLRDHPIRVGRGVSSPFSFYGLIDEVAVYDRVLSGADVLRHYDAGFDIVDD